MGLCISYQPKCPNCRLENVEYVYKSDGWITQLKPWCSNSTIDKVIYLSCRKCIKDVPEIYQTKFDHKKNYRVQK